MVAGFCLESCDSLYSLVTVSSLSDTGLHCNLISLPDVRRIVDFSGGSDFYSVLGQSGHSQLLPWQTRNCNSLIYLLKLETSAEFQQMLFQLPLQ